MAAKARVKFSREPFVQPTALSDVLTSITILILMMMIELFFGWLGTKTKRSTSRDDIDSEEAARLEESHGISR